MEPATQVTSIGVDVFVRPSCGWANDSFVGVLWSVSFVFVGEGESFAVVKVDSRRRALRDGRAGLEMRASRLDVGQWEKLG